MKGFNKDIGNLGEKIALKHYEKLGYKILDKNFYCRIGELDLVSKYNDCIIFTEVKTRYSSKFGKPCESISSHKKYKIIKTAQFYILKNKLKNHNARFDVIEIVLNPDNTTFNMNHITDAFRV